MSNSITKSSRISSNKEKSVVVKIKKEKNATHKNNTTQYDINDVITISSNQSLSALDTFDYSLNFLPPNLKSPLIEPTVSDISVNLLTPNNPNIQIKTDKALIFDVETTGLPISKFIPHIIQLSCIIVNIERTLNIETKEQTVKYYIETQLDYYISIDKSVIIPEYITDLTGITREMCDLKGVNIVVALMEFYNYYKSCDYIVSHNIQFDSKMILLEIERNYQKLSEVGCENPFILFNTLYNRLNNKQIYCTMLNGKDFTNIYVEYKNSISCKKCLYTPPPQKFKKTPKLIELYKFLYPENPIPENLHNALVDTTICMYCFIKMNYLL
jgi:DNA polymerase III epsilon subunit-like protein